METKEIMQLGALSGIIGIGAGIIFFPVQNMEAGLFIIGILATFLGIDTAKKITSA